MVRIGFILEFQSVLLCTTRKPPYGSSRTNAAQDSKVENGIVWMLEMAQETKQNPAKKETAFASAKENLICHSALMSTVSNY